PSPGFPAKMPYAPVSNRFASLTLEGLRLKEKMTSYLTSAIQTEGSSSAQTLKLKANSPILSQPIPLKDHEIKLEGAFNVRDLGGYQTQSGKLVKPHRLLRSARLNHLTDHDVKVLIARYHVGIDFDLRRPEEISEMPDRSLPNVTYINDPVDTDRSFHYPISIKNNRKHYRTYISNPQARKAYHHLLMTLLTLPTDQAILWHCASGKDRTGLGAALILYVLGVDGHTILKDYVASNEFLRSHNQKRIEALRQAGASIEEIHQAKIDGGVDRSYLESAFDEINKEFGSLAAFITHGLRITVDQQAQLRNMYLQ
ncbi:tyrosine-protein phosphatase, partial [Lentilactobacillus fungorum]|uniref:tyrosine-protein phosphatase n=1 Tax=Lentilactobacillus fungorum TaxID=2201250 RepID=UPI00357163C5